MVGIGISVTENTPNYGKVLEDLIDRAGGCAVVDGGFATQLEKHGASINDPLWSALCLIKDPNLIKRVCNSLLSSCNFLFHHYYHYIHFHYSFNLHF